MRRLVVLSFLLCSFVLMKGQNKAEVGTYQIEIPSLKFVNQVELTDELLEEIESHRRENVDRTVTLDNGMKALVISRQSAAKGRRVMAWKLESKN